MKKIINLLKNAFHKSGLNHDTRYKMLSVYRKLFPQKPQDNSVGEIRLNKKEMNEYISGILEQPYAKSIDYVELNTDSRPIKTDIKIFAYYLTQFHPTKENDEWWGKGITEWNNVCRSVPQYIGHYQPRIPGELGYYDLRIKDNIQRQAELAKQYGLSGFCFYYYWFGNGKRILEKPLNTLLLEKNIDIDFFYCWANHSWYKRFDGISSEVLLEMPPDTKLYKQFIHDILIDMNDKRYYKINGKPVLVIYEAFVMDDMKSITDYWRSEAKKKGFKDLYLIAVKHSSNISDYKSYGYDAETEFHPRTIQDEISLINSRVKCVSNNFNGQIYSYRDIVEKSLYKRIKKDKTYSSVMTLWDNTARKTNYALIFHDATPSLYGKWLKDIIDETTSNKNLDDNLIFINAWNEWGEGAYLEPDKYYGYAMLEETFKAINKLK